MKRCCICGGGDPGEFEQHNNRDTGYGVCAACIKWLRERGTSEEEIRDLYGIEGVNFAAATTEAVTNAECAAMVLEYVHDGRTPADQRVLSRLIQAQQKLKAAGIDVLDPVALHLTCVAGE